jgi:hypothetical protein
MYCWSGGYVGTGVVQISVTAGHDVMQHYLMIFETYQPNKFLSFFGTWSTAKRFQIPFCNQEILCISLR